VLVAVLAAVAASLGDPATAQAEGGGYVNKCGEGRIFLDENEKKTFALHNEVRRNNNLPAFCVHPRLQKAARAHSKDMIQRAYFSHDTKGKNETFAERLKRLGYDPQGYRHYKVGENIAHGSGSAGEPEEIMRGWMQSDEHRRNIRDRDFREIGIGTYTGKWEGHNGVTMYTADFGVRRG
jgi:uncharacterized protein YkwD